MSAMNRSRYGLLLLALLVPACKAGGPKGPPGAPAPPPDLLRPYEGASRLLRARGDERALTLRAGERLIGACDVAVRIRSVAFDKGTARFALDTLGTPKVGERGVTCKRVEPGIQLALTGFPSGPVTPEVTAHIDEVLATPEAYLRAKGTAFDHPQGEAPSEVASQLPDAGEGERRLARAVVAWPQLLLSVDPTYRDPSGRVRYEGLVEIEAVVGTDGRLYRSKIKTSLSSAHEGAVLAALPLWRFEPARRADTPVGARIPLRVVFRVY
jgi:hypothetical protein